MTIAGLTIGPATREDATALAGAAMLAGHGIFEMLFENLVPGLSAAAAYRDRRVLKPGHFSHFSNWHVARDAQGKQLGAFNAFPHAELARAAPDPLITPDRLAPLAAMGDIEDEPAGSYYLNLVAVFPEAQGRGIGSALVQHAITLATQQKFPRLSLSTWGDDQKLMSFYARLGFTCAAKREFAPDPRLSAGTSYVLLVKELTLPGP